MRKTFFLLSTLCLFFHLALSQVVKMPGKVMLNDSSELTGWIDYNDWEEAPSEVLFFADSADRYGKRYQVGDLRYFEVFGRQAYTRAPFRNECDHIPRNLQRQSKLYTRLVTEDVFFMVVVGGTYMLAELKHKYHSHLFLYHKKTGWEQLKVGEELNEEGGLIENQEYKDQLIRQLALGAFDDSTKVKLLVRIQNAQQSDITNIIRALNNGVPTYESPARWRQWDAVTVSLGAGLGYSTIRFEGGRPPSSSGPIASFSGNLDFGPSIYKNGLNFRMSFAFVSHHYRNFYFYSIAPGVSLMYSHLLRDGSRLYAGAGAHVYSSVMGSEADKLLYEAGAKLHFDRTWLPTMWKVGVITTRNWEFGLEGIISGGTSNADMRRPNPTGINLYVARHFVLSQARKLSKRKTR